MRKLPNQTWPKLILLGILRILIGIFCGVLIGIVAGIINWIIVAQFRYPFSPSLFDVMIGAAFGIYAGFGVGVLAGIAARGWLSRLILGTIAAITVTSCMIWLNQQVEVASLRFGLLTLFLTAVIWFVTVLLTSSAIAKVFNQISLSPRSGRAAVIYFALSVFYFLNVAYFVYFYFAYREFQRLR